MKYKQIIIEIQDKFIEDISNQLIIAGIGGFEVFDKSEFEKYLTEKPLEYEMVDDSLYDYKDRPSYIKAYAADNEQGELIIKSIADIIKKEFPQAKIQILNQS